MEPLITTDESNPILEEEITEKSLITRWLLPLVKSLIIFLLVVIWLLLSASIS